MSETNRSLIAPVPDRIIHLSITLPKSPEAIFPYFTESRLLQSWLTARAEVEPQVNGKYELYWEPSDPENNSTIGCRITAIERPRLLAFQWRSPEQYKAFANGADPLTHVVVAFMHEDEGTRLHLVHSGWRSDPQWEEARKWQEQAWNIGLEALAGVVAQ